MTEYKNLSKNMYEAICQLHLRPDLDFYFYFINHCNINKKNIDHLAQCYFRKGYMYIEYSPELENQSVDDIIFILIHEMDHLLTRHSQRFLAQSNHYHEIANIAMDTVINENITQLQHLKMPKNCVNLALVERQLKVKYQGDLIFEDLYSWIIDQLKEKKGKNSNDSESDNSDNSDNSGKSVKELVEELKNFDNHVKDIDTTPEEALEKVKGILQELRNRGKIKGNTEIKLCRIMKQRTNVLLHIRKELLSVTGGSNKKNTWMRPHKRGLPAKGYKKVKKELNIILDVSGSMIYELEYIIGFIFRNGFDFNICQIDTNPGEIHRNISKAGLQKMIITGGGGTILQPAIQKFIENRLDKLALIVLTDGYCDSLDFLHYKNKNILIISSGIAANYKGTIKKQIVVPALKKS